MLVSIYDKEKKEVEFFECEVAKVKFGEKKGEKKADILEFKYKICSDDSTYKKLKLEGKKIKLNYKDLILSKDITK